MSKYDLNTRYESNSMEDECEQKNKLQDIKNESLLLNIDIFSSEFDDEVEEDKIVEIEAKEKEIKESQIKENGDVKDPKELSSEDLKIDCEESSFTLSIEEIIEETDIQRSKREFNEYLRKFPEKRKMTGMAKSMIVEDKNKFILDYDFNDISEPTIAKKIKTPKKKKTLFNTNQIKSKRNTGEMEIERNIISKKSRNKFSMEIEQDKIQSNKSSFSKAEKMSVKKEINFKIEVL